MKTVTINNLYSDLEESISELSDNPLPVLQSRFIVERALKEGPTSYGIIPEKGSVGASRDIAPLAHMALPLLGYGEFWNDDGTAVIPAEKCLDAHGIETIDLQAKDGLSPINGTQLMCAYRAFCSKSHCIF